jgi:MFS family permease
MSGIKDSSSRPWAANILKYYLYSALTAFGFGLFVAVWVIYLQEQRGMSLAQAALVDSSFYLAVLLGEIPTGIIADRTGRKTSIIIGVALMTAGVLGWTLAPTLPLILLAYAALGLGFTFTSGATDAFFYESVQLAGRGEDYTRLVGQTGAIFPGGLAVGSVIGGLLASIDLLLPYLVSFGVLLMGLAVTLTFREPRAAERMEGQERQSFRAILSQSLALMRARPSLRYLMIYLALVPIASFMIENVFLQPQAVSLGVPLAGIGLIYTGVQITNMAGSTWADRIKTFVGEGRLLYLAPLITVISLLLLASLQTLSAMALIAVMSFLAAVLRPVLLARIQGQVSDEVRATVISMGSLMFTVAGVISQPTMGFVADRSGLPSAYYGLAAVFTVLVLVLFWTSRRHLLAIPSLGQQPAEQPAA